MNKSAHVIYVDYNATTPVDPEVISAITLSLENNWANPSSSYHLGSQAKQAVESSRRKIARMVNAPNSSDIIFTSGGTEANKLAIDSVIFENVLEHVPHVITSQVEHCSIMLPLLDLEKRGKIDLSIAPVNPATGSVKSETIIELIRNTTKLITIMHANNETGAMMPISKIGSLLEEINVIRVGQNLGKIFFHTDAAQTIGKVIVDVMDLKVDYLTIVGHKFYGPRNGALFARGARVSSPIIPTFLGGGQERGLRSGTENTCIIEGLGVAAELVTKNILTYSQRMAETRNQLAECLKSHMLGFEINFEHGGGDQLPNTLSIAVPRGYTGAEVLKCCNDRVCASLGAACHSSGVDVERGSILTFSGLTSERARRTIRLSVGRGTSLEDVESVAEAIVSACLQKPTV